MKNYAPASSKHDFFKFITIFTPMKKSVFFLSLLGLMASCSQSDELDEMAVESSQESRAWGWFSNEFTVNFNQVGQTLDGFGVAEADVAGQLFNHPKRDEIMGQLFGEEGLNVNILRGEVYPHYSMKPGEMDFATDANINIQPGDPYFSTVGVNELKRVSQFWVSKEAKKYGVDKLFFSTWSAPAWMKEGNQVNAEFIASHGSVKPEHYQDFANYLASFVEAYKKAGLDVYAVSPVNEPNYEADWNSCRWSEAQLADFIAKHMGPTFEKRGVNSQIVFGELAQWSTLLLGNFNVVSAKKYVENVLKANPDVAKYADIAAGHGYNLPVVPYEFPIVEYDKAKAAGLKTWLTEISTAMDKYDPSMKNGLHWAEVVQKYLMNAKVNAFCWWNGARNTTTNESMIKLTETDYQLPKRFYTYGNYTKFIKPGSQQISVSRQKGVPVTLLLTSFKKGDQVVVVAVNKSGRNTTTTMKFNGAKANGSLKSYTTNESGNWKEGSVSMKRGGSYSLTIPAKSVVTFVGNVR